MGYEGLERSEWEGGSAKAIFYLFRRQAYQFALRE